MKQLMRLTLAAALSVTVCAHSSAAQPVEEDLSTSVQETPKQDAVVAHYQNDGNTPDPDEGPAPVSKVKIPHNPYKPCPDGTMVQANRSCPTLKPGHGPEASKEPEVRRP